MEQKTPEQLQQELDAALKSNEVLVQENKDLIQKVAEQQSKIEGLVQTKLSEEKPSAVKSDEVVEYKGKKYQILVPKVHIPGIGVFTALEIASDDEKAAIEYLVEKQSGAIKEVE